MKKQIFKDWSNIAHRGLHDEKIPENSMKAFSKAIKNNYVIELDIHLLKDNNVVVFHDDNLKRMTNKNINIKDVTYEEIKKINLKQTDEKIPLLKDVLKLVDKKVPLLIELKYDQKVPKLEKETIKILKDYDGEYYFQSFSLKSILYMKRKTHKKIGLLVHNNNNKIYNFLINHFLLKTLGIDFISYPIKKCPNKKIEKLSKKMPVLLWTIKKNKQYEIANKYADQIIFENKTC